MSRKYRIAGVLLAALPLALADDNCICDVLPRPDYRQKAEMARWMVHSLNWGILTTVSTRLTMMGESLVEPSGETLQSETAKPVPFGNVYSFSDGTCANSTGTPYLYGTYMDASFTDILSNNAVSLALSENQLPTVCGGTEASSCKVTPKGFGDPENPPYSRLTLSGTLEVLEEGTPEFELAQEALFERHPSMADWPKGHRWLVGKINVQDLWLIDFYGGASSIAIEDYFGVQLQDGPTAAEN